MHQVLCSFFVKRHIMQVTQYPLQPRFGALWLLAPPETKITFERYTESIQPCNMKNRDIYWRRYKKHCTEDNDTSVPFKVGTLGSHTILPVTISCPVIFSWISLMVWNLFIFKGDFSLGKSQKCVAGHQVWAVGGLSHLGNLMFLQKTLHGLWCMSGCVIVIKLPITSCP